MANHRPKSLNELNQVYDKAMKAERAIKQGSMNLSEQTPPTAEKPSENIFDQLQHQAEQTKKAELYDADIASIADNFIKRFAQGEKAERRPAAKELRRPAPSIQSLYHTPVKTDEAEKEDIALGADPVIPSAEEFTARVIKPRAPEKALPSPAEATQEKTQAVPAQEEYKPKIIYSENEDEITEDTAPEAPSSPAAVYQAPHQVSPTVRITSTERNSLMEEYLRVMSDDDDDVPSGRKKKFSLFSRKKKHQEEEELYDSYSFEDMPPEEPASEAPAENYAASAEDEAVFPAQAEEEEEEDNISEELPMNLYDYEESDFGYDQADVSDSEGISLADFEEEASDKSEEAVLSVEEIIAEDFEEEEATEEEATEEEAPEESDKAEEEIIPEAEELTAEEIIAADFDEAEEDICEEESESETEEASEEMEEAAQANEEAPSAEYEEEVIVPAEEENSPTAGMVFDDIFSVSDENMRSYTGGNWTAPADSSNEAEAETIEEAPEEPVKPEKKKKHGKKAKKAKRSGKKGGTLMKVFLSLVLVCLVALTGAVTALGAFIGVDTGKIFGDSNRAFSAKGDFTLSAVYSGDLIITQELSDLKVNKDSFVYVNYETQQFMVGKYKGFTYSPDANVLYIAENEAGRILVAREDTLGAVVETYKGIGSVLGFISENYIIIDAVLLALCLAALVALILPRFRRNDGEEDSVYEQEADEYPAEADDGTKIYGAEPEQAADEYPAEEDSDDIDGEDSEDFDFDYDSENMEEGLFSGI